jgi:hypothetical protein
MYPYILKRISFERSKRRHVDPSKAMRLHDASETSLAELKILEKGEVWARRYQSLPVDRQ